MELQEEYWPNFGCIFFGKVLFILCVLACYFLQFTSKPIKLQLGKVLFCHCHKKLRKTSCGLWQLSVRKFYYSSIVNL